MSDWDMPSKSVKSSTMGNFPARPEGQAEGIVNPLQAKSGRSALFLDRDGVINVDRGYVHRAEAFEFIPGIFELCRAAQSLGYLLLVVTNQAGIARGFYTESDFLSLTKWMIGKFAEQEVRIAHVYYCAFHPVHGIGRYKCDSPDRKPNPGMLLRAREDFNLDLRLSILVGDKDTDIQAAKAAGVGTAILLGVSDSDAGIQKTYCKVSLSLDEVRARYFTRIL